MTRLSRLRHGGWQPWLPILLAVALGALMALALAPGHILWVLPVSLGGISALLLRDVSVRRAALLGWGFGFGYFALGLSWILEPFQVDAERHAWMAPFAVVFLAGGLALFWGAAFAGAARWGRGAARLLLLIALWSLAEFARAYVLTGFPWAAFGQFWVETPAMQLLPWVGPQGLALLTLVAFLPLAMLRTNPVWALLPGVMLAAGVALLPPPPEADRTDRKVRLVQPNAPQHQKWHPEFRWNFVRRAMTFNAEDPRPDMIIWPETSVPQLLNHAEDTLAAITEMAPGVPLLLGIQREEDGAYFNSAVLVGPEGRVRQTYDKAHLVPFGEYVPFGNLMARFGIHGFASQAGAGYAAGPGAQLLDLPIGRALPLICYEAVFPQDVRAAPERPDVLVQITNDAWFGTRSGPYQHLVQARMRAAEQGLPMLRAANTGISGVIDPYGRLGQALPLGEVGYVDVLLPAPLPATLYSRAGDGPVLFLALLLAGLGLRRGVKSPARS
ncbi:apolipoprotein N-acyltransferase [Phaeobacter sp. QD34_3]|uniref:apolipoprotein N-acyltransferase n=1 Tax=unclassified Phaeobacter TaxID=2621772 RepID=UPI00237EF96C|nr:MULTISPECIES: apolipoprotein N-acyltransferase [unclassified Phaeobacter]MDE4135049.1 apolipoprotein N-acyltransferase [Phaeobacter sp. QD34_3]MDE4138679.1 apolipoprotein N-acyltransferase [Phaeobacter sp. QD34_24]